MDISKAAGSTPVHRPFHMGIYLQIPGTRVLSLQSTRTGLLGVGTVLYMECSRSLTEELTLGLKGWEGSCKTPRTGPQQRLLRCEKTQYYDFCASKTQKVSHREGKPVEAALSFF